MTDESNASGNIIPCTSPSCLSAQAAATAGEEIARLKGEVSEVKRLEGLLCSKDTVYGDRVGEVAEALAFELEVAELDRNDYVTINREKLKGVAQRVLAKVDAMAYQRGVEEERARCAGITEEALDATCSCKGCDARRDIADAIRTASPAPQKNTAECQEVCEWTHALDYKSGCGEAYFDDANDATRFKFCPYCGKPIKVRSTEETKP